MTSPIPGPAPLPPSTTPGCSFTGCTTPPLVQWQRRPAESEFAALVAAEQSRRAAILASADPQAPAPVFGPLPGPGDFTIAVFGCGPHAIGMDLAARVHGPDCAAPNDGDLPGCNCTPEPLPEPEPMHAEVATLPDHWAAPAS